MLAALADLDRAFDAIVVGEYERAFFGDQLQHLLPLFQRHGVQLWLPETDGPLCSSRWTVAHYFGRRR